MEIDKSYIKPSIYSLGLHTLVIVLLLMHWESKLDILKPQQRIVAGMTVQKSDLAKIEDQIAEQKKQKPQKPKVEEKTEPKPPDEAIALEKQKEEQKKKEEEQKKKEAEEKKKQEEKKKKEQEKKKKLDQQKKLLEEAMNESELTPKKPAPPSELPPNAVDDPAAGTLDGDEDVARIASKVTSNWSRPASYKKGMTALFVVDLMPNGEVMEVKLVESSGDNGFDASAEAAIRKSSPLPVPQDPKRFEAYFRKLNFQFMPEQL